MTYPKKSKGWRKIVVDGQDFRWRYDDAYDGGLLKAQGTEPPGQQLEVEFLGYFSWVTFADIHRGVTRCFDSVTPKLAAETILFALANGWQPNRAAFPMRMTYENQVFSVTPPCRPIIKT